MGPKLQLILATESSAIRERFPESGFYSLRECEIESILFAKGGWFGPRSTLEEDRRFLQIIAYVVLQCEAKILTYSRAVSGGEARLHGLRSVGLGGHVDLNDFGGGDVISLDTVASAAGRELDEEIGSFPSVENQWIGILVDWDSEVGQVHVGVVQRRTVAEFAILAPEHAIDKPSFISVAKLREDYSSLETWSQHLLADSMFDGS